MGNVPQSSFSRVSSRDKLISVNTNAKTNRLIRNDINTIQEDEECNNPAALPRLMSSLEEYSLNEISKHNKKDDLWIVIDNFVYDVTSFWELHPVSSNLVYQFGGKDASDSYNAASHSSYATELLEKMKIGIVSKHDRKDIYQSRISIVDWYDLKHTETVKPIRIKSICIYPVKGCKGIELRSAVIEQNGILNDRIYCIVDGESNVVVNQLKFPKLCLIQPVLKNVDSTEDHKEIELFYFDKKYNKKNKIVVPRKRNKDKMISIKFKNSSSPILSYDQGDKISEWITKFILDHHEMEQEENNKTFRFCKILKNNERYNEDYFSLPFIDKKNQPIKGVLNYSAINIISQESLNELNKRWSNNDKLLLDYMDNNNQFIQQRFRVNIVLEGLPKAHFEDFIKFLSINDGYNDVELLWNRRRYFCTCPNVNQSVGTQTSEPQKTLSKYRNAITLNDRTSLPGDNAVFFGSFFLVKKGGPIKIEDTVEIKQTQFNILRTNRQKSYFGLNEEHLDENFKLKSLMEWNKYKLIKKIELNHDCYHLRFTLNDDRILQHHESLTLKIGGHYLLKIMDPTNINVPCIRAYTPIIHGDDDNDDYDDNKNEIMLMSPTRNDEDENKYDDKDNNNNNNNNYFDLIVKIYKNGKMTQYLTNMKINDIIDGKQKYNTIKYIEIGKFRFGDPSYSMFKHYTLNTNYINMICGGTGISPMFQIINYINLNKHIDTTKICLLYSNKTRNDILLLNKLNKIAKNNKNIKVYHVITSQKQKSSKIRENIKISHFGRINKEIIEKYTFKPNDDCISLLCGPVAMENAMKEYLKQCGFNDKNVHSF